MGSAHPNIGPGGCVPWDHIAEWMQRVDIHMRAADAAANIDGATASDLRPLWTVLGTLRDELDHAMAVLHIESKESSRVPS